MRSGRSILRLALGKTTLRNLSPSEMQRCFEGPLFDGTDRLYLAPFRPDPAFVVTTSVNVGRI
jgi:hypothetical protein